MCATAASGSHYMFACASAIFQADIPRSTAHRGDTEWVYKIYTNTIAISERYTGAMHGSDKNSSRGWYRLRGDGWLMRVRGWAGKRTVVHI